MIDESPPPTGRSPGVGPVLWIGLLVVLVAAAALSFDALRNLADAVSIPTRLAPLLPIAIDVGAAVSCATWLSRRVDDHTAAFARRMTFALLALTVAGNAAQLGMHANNLGPPWWAAVVVGAVPPGVAGAIVHLIVLVTRTGSGPVPNPLRAVVDDETPERARELIAGGAGRPRVAAELGLTDHQARRLVQQIREPLERSHGEQPGEPVTTRRGQDDHTDGGPDPYPSANGVADPDHPRPEDRGGSGGERERQARAHPQAVGEG